MQQRSIETATSNTAPPGPASILAGLILPDRLDTALLRACLHSSKNARLAFAEWVHDTETALAHLQSTGGLRRRLLPLLHGNAVRENFDVPPALQPPLRAAALYEQLRSEAYRQIASDTLDLLQREGLPFLATRGVVFCHQLYRNEELRHCHDLDLLLSAEYLTEAARVLAEKGGFTQRTPVSVGPDLLLYHSSGLPLILHSRPLACRAFSVEWQQVWNSSHSVAIGSVDAHTMSPEHTLLQVLLHGPFVPQGRSLVWLCDACKLIATGKIVWPDFLRKVAGHEELVVVLLGLTYLSSKLGCDVPEEVAQILFRRWSALPLARQRAVEDRLLFALVHQGVVDKRTVLRHSRAVGQSVRAMRAVFLPHPATLVQMEQIGAASEAPRYWAREAFGMARRQLLKRKTVAATDHATTLQEAVRGTAAASESKTQSPTL